MSVTLVPRQWGFAASSTSANWHGSDTEAMPALIGFTTFDGRVTAASDWGASAERKRVRPARDRTATRRCCTLSVFPSSGCPRPTSPCTMC